MCTTHVCPNLRPAARSSTLKQCLYFYLVSTVTPHAKCYSKLKASFHWKIGNGEEN